MRMRPILTDVVANEHLRARLGDELLAGKLSHAYILSGECGFGKHTLALHLAAALACENAKDAHMPLPCLRCPACRKILSGNSPDVIYVNRGDKATLGVDPIREIRQDVYIPPNDLSVKVYIIEEAHLMTPQAQNAFLLTLEEPPAYVLFLLLCENPSLMLETVLSRAPVLRLEPVQNELILHHICAKVPEAKRMAETDRASLEELVVAADGSIGRALALLDPKLYKPLSEKRELARNFAHLCASPKSTAQAMRFINSLGSRRDELIEQFSTILLCLRDLLLCKQTENAPLCFFSDREEAASLAYSFTTPTLLSLCDSVSEAADRLRANANVRLTIIAMAQQCNLL
jgi:DNA polymerase-3 subunit delta'